MTGAEIAIGKAFFDVFKWVWDKFPAQSVWNKFKHKTAAKAYAQKMKKRYGMMQLWHMSAPTSVEKIFTQVNVLKKQSAFQNTPKDQLEEIYLNQAPFGGIVKKGKDGMAAVAEHHRLFILGKPGAGKTTFLKHIVLEAIADKLEAIPIFISLREFSESKQSLIALITEQFDICNFPEAQPFIETILKQGKAIVLFDGLDEVNKEGGLRKKLIQSIKDFSDKYDQSKVVITCRVAATDYNFEGFTLVEMADFNDEQIRVFVTKWFVEDQRTSEHFLSEFEQQAGNRLKDLAKTPLLLTLLCIGFEDTHRFSSRRSEIYGEALDALLKKRDRADGIERDEIYQKLSLGRKKQMFAQIAAETFEQNDYLIEKKHLEKRIVDCLQILLPGIEAEDIDGEDLLKAIEAQHGIFVECAKDIYSFAHLSFQEYYAAQYIVAQPESRLPRLMKYADDPRWREVFLLTAEMLDDVDGFFEPFLNRIDEFALKKTLKKILPQEGEPFSLKQRANLVFLELETAFDLFPTSSLASALDQILPLSSAQDLPFEMARALALDLKLALDFGDECALRLSLSRSIRFSSQFVSGHTIAFGRPAWYSHILKMFENTLSLSKRKGPGICHHLLSRLSIPSEKASQMIWQEFGDSLLEIFKMTFPIEKYEFSQNECYEITRYLEATQLLLDCLDVAHVSDRKAIEDQLLRPLKN